jgi:ribonuclease R
MARTLPSRGDIVRCLVDAGRALHAREIANRCDVPERSYPHLLELLDQLSFDGTVRRMGGSRFGAQRGVASAAPSWEGLLKLHPRGFGFVNAAGQDDVYVAPDGIGAALHGDRVRVSVIGKSARGVEGRIEEVVSRRNPRVAGVLRRRGKSAWLEPDDARLRGPIVVADVKDGRDGDAAVVSITRFPESANENPEGELVAVLGAPGDPNTEVAKILIREQIVETHPEGAVREAETMAARLTRLTPEGRVDLRDVPLPTIDPEDARDHDDAVWVERRDAGYRAWIAIADVSEYVQPGSELDKEALARGCTIYLPDRAIPMLPAALASDLCSLLPDRERLCLCVIADLDKDGKVRDYEIVEGVMRSAAMLTYGGVARALGFSEEPPKSAQAEALKRDLKCVDELARKLRRSRMRRGSLDLDLPEAKVQLDDETGSPVGVVRRATDEGIKRAYQMIEELMLLANELVAKWLSKRRAPAIYRIHGKPDETKLERLGQVAEKLGVRFEQDEMLEPLGAAKWLRQIQDHPKKRVLEMLLLRSLKQAAYDIANIGHFGLASDNYLHFTSPIRRYPDLLVHRSVKHLLRGGKIDNSPGAVEALRVSATRASERERAAMEVEREVVDLYRALYMRAFIEEIFEGTVVAFVGSGVYVSLDDPFVDVLVRFESLGPDQYSLSDDELSAVGARSGDRVELGERMVVQIEDVAILRRAVFARRIVPEATLQKLGSSRKRGAGDRERRGAPAPRGGRAGGRDRSGRSDGQGSRSAPAGRGAPAPRGARPPPKPKQRSRKSKRR